jgi:tRNA-specific 2-thiouridylase
MENQSAETHSFMKKNSNSKVKIAIGMSGGVDSSVAAFLLKQQGYDVVGFFMKLWHDPCGTGENACCDEKAQMDARKVADVLEIPFYVIDAREPFKREITDYFINEYENLRTPNPCVVCNKKIKFGWLLDFALKSSCDYLATGHYARVSQKPKVKSQNYNSKLKNDQNSIFHLFKAKDESKDQSYFLSGLSQEQLSKIILPLGELTKKEVREIARANNLPIYKKKESQEVCFVEDDYRKFIKRNTNAKFSKGQIIDSEGTILGSHSGLIDYTIGQRKGVNQELRVKNYEDKEPLYVIKFDKEKNRLIVGTDNEIYKSDFTIRNINLINSKKALDQYSNLTVKVRSRANDAKCSVVREKVKLSLPQRAITPGQFAVFYSGEEVVGNATIK